MDERHARCLLGQDFQGQGYHGYNVAPTRFYEVVGVDIAFFRTGKHVDNAAQGSGFLEKW